MRKVKEKIIRKLIKLGKENRRLRIPALVFIALFLVIYHAIAKISQQFRYHPIRQGVLAGILIMLLLAGYAVINLKDKTAEPNDDGAVTVPAGSVIAREWQEPVTVTEDGAMFDPQTGIITSIEGTKEVQDDSSDISEDTKEAQDNSSDISEGKKRPTDKIQSLDDANDRVGSIAMVIIWVYIAVLVAGGVYIALIYKRGKE